MKIETKKGLRVSSLFTEKFGIEIEPSKDLPPFKVLPRNMTDAEIVKEYGECEIGDVAAFLENPPKGADDGNWNLFYVPGCVVRVGWEAGYRRWCVDAWKRDDDCWFAGYRVFVRNCPSDTLPSELGDLESLKLRVEKLEDIIKHHNLVERDAEKRGRENILKNVGMLRQWINERPEGSPLLTNEDIKHFLLWEAARTEGLTDKK